MENITGLKNETDFSNCLNKKKINDLNPMFQNMIYYLYGNIDDHSDIMCYVDNNMKKTDLIIKINKIVKRISVKKGIKNSVHVEGISDFISFLIKNSIPKNIIIKYLHYQYADGTTNGTGKYRLSVEEYKKSHQNEIDEINKYLNSSDILEKAIERFIIQGRNSINRIDLLIYGTIDDFLWISNEDLKQIILSKINNYSTAVHFGPLTVQPMNRCLNYNSKYERLRFCVQIKWYNLFDAIIENMNSKIEIYNNIN